MQLSKEQAEKILHEASIKESPWQSGVGCRFRVYKIHVSFDLSSLPQVFEVLWHDDNECVVCEWEYDQE